MVDIEPAVPDVNWLDADELYFARGGQCEIDRPLFQGDVFSDVWLPLLPNNPVRERQAELEFAESMVMVVPHPCQCYHGDKLRSHITVAPLKSVIDYSNFGDDYSGAKDKFALPEFIYEKAAGREVSYVADFGRLVSVPNRYLQTKDRISCLTHEGIGLLSKRFIQFQARIPSELNQVMAATYKQWNESFLMQAWVQKHRKLRGFTKWCTTEQVIPGINEGRPMVPGLYIESALEELLDAIKGLPDVLP